MKRPAGYDQLRLYLDYDGVLHHENVRWKPRVGAYIDAAPEFKLFQHSELLEQVLAPYPGVKIVLSTSWVLRYSFSKAAKHLRPALRERVVGATYHSRLFKDEFSAAPRGMQVWGDVVKRKPRDWLALDDTWLDWPKWCLDKYIRTHEHHGISDPEVLSTLKEKLAEMCR